MEYGVWQVTNTIMYIVMRIVLILHILSSESSNFQKNSGLIEAIIWILIIYFFAALIPSLSVTARRLHDTNHSAWWILLLFVPYCNLSWIFIGFYLLLADGTPGPNRYGPDPKGRGGS